MKHLKYIFSLVFLMGMLQTSKAQTRDGVQLTIPVVKIGLETILDSDDITHLPQIGYYRQRWITDRIFKYRSLCFQHIGAKYYHSPGVLSQKGAVNVLDFNFGRGMYWNHHEFEDDYAWYTTLGWSVGLGLFTGKSYTRDGQVSTDDALVLPTFTVFRVGIGFEKKIQKDLVGNFSAEINAGLLPYIALNFRLMKNNY